MISDVSPTIYRATVVIPKPIGQQFSYLIPHWLESQAKVGQFVSVPFGKKQEIGCIWSISPLSEDEDTIRLKYIQAVLMSYPSLNIAYRSFLEKLSQYYHVTMGEALKLALPSIPRHKACILTTLGASQLKEGLDPIGRFVGHLLSQAPLKRRTFPFPISREEWSKWEKNSWVIWQALPQELEPLEIMIQLNPTAESVETISSLPRSVRTVIADLQSSRSIESLNHIRGLRSKLRTLIEADLLTGCVTTQKISTQSHCSTEISPQVNHTHADITLTQEQQSAVDDICNHSGYHGYLLHGVTGSGKTEVYLEVIEYFLNQGKNALVLVPEIGLTPQTIRRFQDRLTAPVFAWHSQLNTEQRIQTWRAVSNSETKVLVGARSALFCPLYNLGVVIIDEAHDSSYKQSEGCRYHARDMAILRASIEQCPVILGSATPSLESIQNTVRGKLKKLTLTQRPHGAQLPRVTLIDLTEQNAPDARAPALSRPLISALKSRLNKGEQSILFLNRRGFSQSIRCISCGYIFKCPECVITLPWHQKVQRLKCHHCDFHAPLPHQCPSCERSNHFLPVGRGTERLEQQLQSIFPTARIERIDQDSELQSSALDHIMRSGAVDILIGTQMVAKGHDFPQVTLVGVIDADGGLNFPDFRAAERTFQLLSQVAGRAGRAALKGEVLIQTYRPKDPLMQAVLSHDFEKFCAHELSLREMIGYPPFTYCVVLRIEGPPGERLQSVLVKTEQIISQHLSDAVIRGPNPSPIEQIRGRRRWLVFILSPNRTYLHTQLKTVKSKLRKLRKAPINILIDVDPQDFF